MFVTQASLPPCVFLRWRVLKITRAVNQKECGSPKSFKNGTSTVYSSTLPWLAQLHIGNFDIYSTDDSRILYYSRVRIEKGRDSAL
ncbi:hypothetical protein ACOSP7_028802 [Xanthoceras sorbifolium]